MCLSGGGGSNDALTYYQLLLSQQQMEQSASDSAAALAEQQREFNISAENRATDLANTAAQQAASQAQADAQAALTERYQLGRNQEANQARDSVNSAFAKFTPDYYSNYVQAYMNNYNPEIQRQYEVAQKNLTYGLARQGITQSQSAATQSQLLAEEKGRNEADVAGKAVDASNTLQSNVENARSNLLSTALSDQTLGSPITPGSADAVTSAFDSTSRALTSLASQSGDVVNTLSAAPTYNALGNLFGSAASGVANYVTGNQYYNAYGGSSSPTSSSPSSSSSYRTVG